MQYLAQISPAELTSILALFIGMLGGFYALVKSMMSIGEKAQAMDREERRELIASFNRVATATETAAREAKERNGHLAELTIESKQATIEAIKCIKMKQNVHEQHVDNQTVEHETVTTKEVI